MKIETSSADCKNTNCFITSALVLNSLSIKIERELFSIQNNRNAVLKIDNTNNSIQAKQTKKYKDLRDIKHKSYIIAIELYNTPPTLPNKHKVLNIISFTT